MTRRCKTCGLDVRIPDELKLSEVMCPECRTSFPFEPIIRVTDHDAGLQISGQRRVTRVVSRQGAASILLVAIGLVTAGLVFASIIKARDPFADGSEGTLSHAAHDPVVLFDTSETARRFMRDCPTDDVNRRPSTLLPLSAEGKLTRLREVEPNAAILRSRDLDGKYPVVQVQILTGEDVGVVGWIEAFRFHPR
jgi:hypothetical protein